MPSRKIIFAALVISSALFASYFIVSFSSKKASAENSGSENRTLASEIKKGAALITKEVLNIIQPDNAPGNMPPEDQAIGNLTDYFVKIITEQVKAKNSAGLTQKEDGSLAILAPSDESIEKQLEDLFAKQHPAASENNPLYHPQANEAKLQIISDTSSEAQLQYVRNFIKLTRELSKKYQIDINTAIKKIEEKEDGTYAKQIAATQEEIAARYAALSTPKNWVDFEMAVLSHYYAARDTWRNIANFQSDPLQALLSLQELELIQQSQLGIIVLLQQEVSKRGLNYDPANEQ